MKTMIVASLLSVICIVAFAQDPVKTSPQFYKVLLENDQVRVIEYRLKAGEKEAMHLGVDVKKVQLVVYLAASALTGLAVSVSGSIGYVGLIVPHLMRMIFGTDYRMLLPASAFGGWFRL